MHGDDADDSFGSTMVCTDRIIRTPFAPVLQSSARNDVLATLLDGCVSENWRLGVIC